MAYDQLLVDRICNILDARATEYTHKKMMGGMLFMVDNKMLCGTFFEKKVDVNVLMARIGPDAYPSALLREDVLSMDFTGRPMNGFVFVKEQAIDQDDDLEYWMDLCLQFNPLAKASKKRKSKI